MLRLSPSAGCLGRFPGALSSSATGMGRLHPPPPPSSADPRPPLEEAEAEAAKEAAAAAADGGGGREGLGATRRTLRTLVGSLACTCWYSPPPRPCTRYSTPRTRMRAEGSPLVTSDASSCWCTSGSLYVTKRPLSRTCHSPIAAVAEVAADGDARASEVATGCGACDAEAAAVASGAPPKDGGCEGASTTRTWIGWRYVGLPRSQRTEPSVIFVGVSFSKDCITPGPDCRYAGLSVRRVARIGSASECGSLSRTCFRGKAVLSTFFQDDTSTVLACAAPSSEKCLPMMTLVPPPGTSTDAAAYFWPWSSWSMSSMANHIGLHVHSGRQLFAHPAGSCGEGVQGP